jgi:hypothetical protein
MKSVAILGCGPSGLLVAHAAELCGWDFRIFSKKQKSPLHGAQYLHQAIPNLDCGTPQMIEYKLNGTPEQYRHKVYGTDWDGVVSPEDYWEAHYAWDIRRAYSQLWDKYEDEIQHWHIDDKWYMTYKAGLSLAMKHDLVISTVPRTVWDSNPANFESTKIWALGDTEMPRVDPAYRPAPFTVFCEGDHRVPWYRVSNIFDYCTVEWPYDPLKRLNSRLTLRSPHKGASVVIKPLRYTGSAAPDFVHLGRYGAWQKGVLTSDVFFEAIKVFASDKIS